MEIRWKSVEFAGGRVQCIYPLIYWMRRIDYISLKWMNSFLPWQVVAVMEVLVINCATNYTMECTSATAQKALNWIKMVIVVKVSENVIYYSSLFWGCCLFARKRTQSIQPGCWWNSKFMLDWNKDKRLCACKPMSYQCISSWFRLSHKSECEFHCSKCK